MDATKNKITFISNELCRNTQFIFGERLRRIIMYGSRARGDYKEYSDMDIMVLADYNEHERRGFEKALSRVASDLGLEHDIIVSVMLNNENLFVNRLLISPFYRNVVSEGVVLYGEHQISGSVQI